MFRSTEAAYRLAAVACAATVALLGGSAAAAQPPTHIGSGANEVWILRPSGVVRDIVIFGHGWSTPLPSDGFAPWIAHLRAEGSIVIYPRYRDSAGDSTSAALLAFRTGVVAGLRTVERTDLPILALGKSFGASAVFYYAAEARTWHVRGPSAVVSIFPAYPIGAFPTAALPRNVYARILVGDRDTTAGSGGATAFWRWLATHPARLKSYRVIRSLPGFVADHDSAQRSDPVARRIFWQPVDALLARIIRNGGHY